MGKHKIFEKLALENYSARITYRQPRGKKSERYLARCGCGCKNSIEIYPNDDGTLEVGGVIIHKEQLLKILGKK